MREVIESYAFGLDAACIALSCAVFEQLLKDELVRRAAYTEPQIDREHLTAEGVLAKGKQFGLIKESARDAESLVKKRNIVMHRHAYDDKVRSRLALDAVRELVSVVSEVLADESGER